MGEENQIVVGVVLKTTQQELRELERTLSEDSDIVYVKRALLFDAVH